MQTIKTKNLFSKTKILTMASGEKLEYCTSGSKPRYLFISGIHGDETGVIEQMRKALDEAACEFPTVINNIVRVLHANPAAIAKKTLKDEKWNLNREFKKEGDGGIIYPRARLLLQLLAKFPELIYVFSFHEDPDEGSQFYMYDIPQIPFDNEQKFANQAVQRLRRMMLMKENKDLGGVFTGIDDPKDPKLGSMVTDGYVKQPTETVYDDTFENYATETGRLGKSKIKRSFVFETPNHLTDEQKYRVVKIVINDFITPFLQAKAMQ